MEDIGNYQFLTHGSVPVSGVDDTAEFRQTVEALTIMGISPEDQSGKYNQHPCVLVGAGE